MKYRVPVKQAENINIEKFLRSLGWAQIYDRRRDKYSYVKRLSRDFYPRLHLYVMKYPDNYVFDMHLDQKKASYKGQKAHSGEYDSDLVVKALNEIKAYFQVSDSSKESSKYSSKVSSNFKEKDIINNLGGANAEEELEDLKKKNKKSWFKRLFT